MLDVLHQEIYNVLKMIIEDVDLTISRIELYFIKQFLNIVQPTGPPLSAICAYCDQLTGKSLHTTNPPGSLHTQAI